MKINCLSLKEKLRRWAEKGLSPEKEFNIEKSSFLELFKYIYLPILFFSLSDHITTYIGVCVLHGIELNPLAPFLARYGYLFITSLNIGSFTLIALLLTFLLKKSSRNELMKIVFIVFWINLLIFQAKTIAFNINSLATMILHKYPVQPHKLTEDANSPQEMVKIIQQANITFTPHRNDFCRVLP